MPSSKDTSGRMRLGTLFRRLRLLVVVTLGLLLVLGALAWWRLSRGPVSFDRFTGSIEELVDGEIAPLSLELGGASLVWHGWGGPLEVRVRDVGVRKEDGEALVTVSGAALAAAKGPLLRGAIAPVWLEVKGVHATLVRGEDGRIDLGLQEKPVTAESEAPNLADLADRWLAPPNPDTPLGRLTTIRVRDASLRLEDHVLDLVATADQVDIELSRGEALLDVSIPLSVEIDDTTTQLNAAVTYRLDQGSIQARLDAPALEPSRLAHLSPGLEVLSALDLRVELHVEAEISEELEIETSELDLRGDWGRVLGQVTFTDGFETLDGRVQLAGLQPWRFADLAPEVERLKRFRHPLDGEIEAVLEGGALRSGSFRLHGAEGADDWGEISGQVQFAAAAEGPSGRGGNAGDDDVEHGEDDGVGPIGNTLTGEVKIERLKPWMFAGVSGVEALEGIRLPLAAQAEFEIDEGEVQALQLEIESGAGEVAVAEIYPEPLRVRSLELEASAQDGFGTVRLDRLAVDLGDVQPRVVAQATRRDGRYAVRATATLEQMRVDLLKHYWPPTKAPRTQKWIAAHVPAGTARDVVFEVALDVDPDGESRVQNAVLSGSMAYDGLVLDVLAPKPPVEGISGTATFEEGTLAFDVAGGTLKDFQVEGADVAITGLESKKKPKHLAVDLTGLLEVATALDLLSGEPLDVVNADRFAGLSGQTKTRLQLGLKLSGPERHLEWAAQSQATNVSWSGAPLGLQVSEGDLTVEASPQAVAVRGTARANGVPAEIDYRQDLEGGDPALVADVRARVDEAGLLALGLPEQPYLSGTTAVHFRYSRGADGFADVAADLDLHDSQLEIRELDWRKPVGQDGGANIVVRQQSERAWSVERFEVAAADLKAGGSVEFLRKPFRLERLDLPRVELPDNRIQASLHRTDEGGYRLRVSGRRYNLQPPLERLRRGEARRSRGAGEGAESAEAAAPGDTASEAERSEADRGLPPITIEVRFDQLYLSPEARLDGFEASAAYDGDHWTRAAASATIEPEAGVSLTYGPADDGYRFEARADRYQNLAAISQAQRQVAARSLAEVGAADQDAAAEAQPRDDRAGPRRDVECHRRSPVQKAPVLE